MAKIIFGYEFVPYVETSSPNQFFLHIVCFPCLISSRLEDSPPIDCFCPVMDYNKAVTPTSLIYSKSIVVSEVKLFAELWQAVYCEGDSYKTIS